MFLERRATSGAGDLWFWVGLQCRADEELDKLLLSEGFAIDSKLGFTDPIRWVFGISRTPLSPVEIRDDLLKMGIGSDQVNLLSSIHTVLRRMAEAEEIERTQDSRFRLPR